jgi:hypothetical protein
MLAPQRGVTLFITGMQNKQNNYFAMVGKILHIFFFFYHIKSQTVHQVEQTFPPANL